MSSQKASASAANLIPANVYPRSDAILTPAKAEFSRFIQSRDFLDVAWNINDELDFTFHRDWRSRLKNWAKRFREKLWKNLGNLLLALPSLCILPILLSVPYVQSNSLQIALLLICPILILTSVAISLLRLRHVELDMKALLLPGFRSNGGLEQLQTTSAGTVAFLPPIVTFLKKEFTGAWTCGALEIVGLVYFSIELRDPEALYTEASLFFLFLMFPLLDVFRSMYEERARDKIYSVIAYNDLAVMLTRYPWKFDPVTSKFQDGKDARAMSFMSIASLKLGVTRMKEHEQRQTISTFPYVFHLIFRSHSIDESSTDSSKLLCLRMLPYGVVRDKNSLFSVAVDLLDTKMFLEVLKQKCGTLIAPTCTAVQQFLDVLYRLQIEFEQGDIEWVDGLFGAVWASQSAFV
mmetsp:Transcript_22161/g.36716  ORF Transcript_22161/g.36716 Transcript_22161/m.36716 type:complete len:407 (-) Transcript_22161:199-1419(-)|eukprot:CAMPEP_0184661086 /NCGR_PEP_ID=MMETSP0308-20130426/36902_1 /TAXON_ID=38269 /ORGANISM="Gloeochaete witrockiana, Strain SAG 46.84" /LENGTH=406 /DNA_ID=CAMNT_0027102161 /DNA_START=103 /DNA_END=1323 /DNA_ORIENTATION=+